MTRAVIRGVDGLIFDLDGTLVDSEHLTGRAVREHLRGAGVEAPPPLDEELHGVTWEAIAAGLRRAHPALRGRCTGAQLHQRCARLWEREPPVPMPGVLDALARARAAGLRLAIATSSNGETARRLLLRPGFGGVFEAVVTADDIERSKPDPQIMLLAAERLGVAPSRALVFEDSLAGLESARAAGMRAVAILLRCAAPERARRASVRGIRDFTELEGGFFVGLAGPG